MEFEPFLATPTILASHTDARMIGARIEMEMTKTSEQLNAH